MARLIDTDKLKEDIILYSQLTEFSTRMMSIYFSIIDKQPTAYDVDKVLEELRDATYKYYTNDASIPYDEATKIVKAGGINVNT